jgi:MFS family permease
MHILAVGARALIFLGFWSLWMFPQHGLQVGMLVSMSLLAGITWSMLAVSAPVLVGYLTMPGQNGTAMGIYTATKGLSTIVGALLGGYLAHGLGYAIAFACAAGLALLGLIPLGRFTVPPSPEPHMLNSLDPSALRSSRTTREAGKPDPGLSLEATAPAGFLQAATLRRKSLARFGSWRRE